MMVHVVVHSYVEGAQQRDDVVGVFPDGPRGKMDAVKFVMSESSRQKYSDGDLRIEKRNAEDNGLRRLKNETVTVVSGIV